MKGRDWVTLLTEEEFENYYRNTMEFKDVSWWSYIMDKELNSFSDFIMSGFTWSSTPEGYHYWVQLFIEDRKLPIMCKFSVKKLDMTK